MMAALGDAIIGNDASNFLSGRRAESFHQSQTTRAWRGVRQCDKAVELLVLVHPGIAPMPPRGMPWGSGGFSLDSSRTSFI